VLQKALGCLPELCIASVGLFDHLAEPLKDGREVGLELLDSLAELSDLSAFVGKEQFEQSSYRRYIVNRTALDLAFVLDEDGLRGILKDDVVLRVTASQLKADLSIEIILFVLRLPIAKRHAQRMQQRAVHVAPLLRRGGDFVLWNEDEIMRPCPTLEQIFERFTNHRLAMSA